VPVSERFLSLERERRYILVSYPISTGLQSPFALQKPKTPKLTPSKDPRGIAVMIGVDMMAISSSANAAKSSTVNGVAGRNMVNYRLL